LAGSFAEYVSVPWEKVVTLPDEVTYSAAAGSILQGLTALTFVTEAYEVKKVRQRQDSCLLNANLYYH
jgi:NADPH:quinone reductase